MLLLLLKVLDFINKSFRLIRLVETFKINPVAYNEFKGFLILITEMCFFYLKNLTPIKIFIIGSLRLLTGFVVLNARFEEIVIIVQEFFTKFCCGPGGEDIIPPEYYVIFFFGFGERGIFKDKEIPYLYDNPCGGICFPRPVSLKYALNVLSKSTNKNTLVHKHTVFTRMLKHSNCLRIERVNYQFIGQTKYFIDKGFKNKKGLNPLFPRPLYPVKGGDIWD